MKKSVIRRILSAFMMIVMLSTSDCMSVLATQEDETTIESAEDEESEVTIL